MKKLLVALVALALVVWVVSWFRAPDAVTKSEARPWPGGMGTLESLAERLPPQEANEASRKLTALAGALPQNEAVDEYVAREIARDDLTIGAPPAIPDVTAIRELLLRERIVWKRHAEFDDVNVGARRVLQMTTARTLVASALTKARANDPAAWEELHAVWNLARAQEGQPQMMAQTAALTMVRMINAVAWKMPLPAPAWLGELHARDYVRPLLEAFQYQTASYSQGATLFPTKLLATSVDKDRSIAEELYNATQCDVKTRMNDLGPDLSSVWRRVFRYRAEREATANALRVRNETPIETKSACSDGTWSQQDTTLRFSREIPLSTDERPMPLTLRVAPPAQ